MSPALFALVNFEIGSCANAQAGLDWDPSIYASCGAGMTGVSHHTQHMLAEMGSRELFAQADLELISASQVPFLHFWKPLTDFSLLTWNILGAFLTYKI
jgi:hypothetical protein